LGVSSPSIAFECICDEHPWDILASLEELAEELLRRVFVTPALYQNIQDVPLLIHRPPQIVAILVHRNEDLLEMPFVAGSWTAATQLMGILLPEFATPLPDGLVGHDDAADEQEFLHITIAQTETGVEPDPMADDLGRETVVLVAVGWCRCIHTASMAYSAKIVQTTRQVDNAGRRVGAKRAFMLSILSGTRPHD
jgi:hypothetical protein